MTALLDLLEGRIPSAWTGPLPSAAYAEAGEAEKDPARAILAAVRAACAAACPGKGTLAYAATEAEGGSDLSASRTRIEEKGGEILVDGEKSFVVADPATEAFLVWGLEGVKNPRASAVVVPRDAVGVETTPLPPLPGLASLPVLRARFAGARVPVSARLGAAGEGMAPLEELLARGHRDVVSVSEGVARAARRELAAAVKDRASFGKPLGEHLPVAEGIARLAMIETTLRAARNLLGEGDAALAAVAKAEATDRLATAIGEILPLAGARGLQGRLPELLLAAQSLRLLFGGNGTLRLYAVHRALPSEAKRRPVPWFRSLFSRPRLPIAHASLAPIREAVEEGTLLLSGRGRDVRAYYGSNLAPAGLETDRVGRLAGEVLFLAALGLAADAAISSNADGAARRVRLAALESRAAFARMLRLSRDLHDFDDAAVLDAARSGSPA